MDTKILIKPPEIGDHRFTDSEQANIENFCDNLGEVIKQIDRKVEIDSRLVKQMYTDQWQLVLKSEVLHRELGIEYP